MEGRFNSTKNVLRGFGLRLDLGLCESRVRSREQAEQKYMTEGNSSHTRQIRIHPTEIAKLVDSGQLKPAVETVPPLSEARHARELNETEHARGKIVLKLPNTSEN